MSDQQVPTTDEHVLIEGAMTDNVEMKGEISVNAEIPDTVYTDTLELPVATARHRAEIA